MSKFCHPTEHTWTIGYTFRCHIDHHASDVGMVCTTCEAKISADIYSCYISGAIEEAHFHPKNTNNKKAFLCCDECIITPFGEQW